MEIVKTIAVTKSDIKNGVPEDLNFCAIAKAVSRTFRNNLGVCISDSAEVVLENKDLFAIIPKRVMNFISKFDKFKTGVEASKKLKPFSFKVKFVESE